MLAMAKVSMDNATIFLFGFSLGLVYFASLVIYRLYFHPLAKFPGPKIAVATYWYEFYYDMIKKPGGQYMYRLDELHAQYGPILRINPDEIQIKDAMFFDQVYPSAASKLIRNRWPRANTASSSPYSTASTGPHHLHRLRRSALNPYFSKAAISRLEPRIQSQLALMCDRLGQCAKDGSVIEIGTAYTALTMDVITLYCFNRSWQCLTTPNFHPAWKRVMNVIFATTQPRKHVPLYGKVFESLPKWLTEWLDPDMALAFESRRLVHEQVAETVNEKPEDASPGRSPTIFHEILNSSLPPEEKSLERLSDEGLVIVVAAAETTATTLASMTYHVLSNPDILRKLRSELDAVMTQDKSSVPLRELESLPYLTAVIKEGLRMAAPFTNRSLLYSPDEPIQYQGWTIPTGTPVCMSSNRLLHDATIFHEPRTFLPDRWLGPAEERQLMERAFVPFHKGKRGCLGINLAWAELYLVTAYVFYRFDLELVDTDRARDVDVVRDCFVGLPSPESRGIKVKLAKRKL